MFKLDYDPLLSAGRHEMTIEGFYSQFVIGLGGSRHEIWSKFKTLIIDEIIQLDIKCEIWLDGSFLTRCDNPRDIDGSIMIDCNQVKELPVYPLETP